tara:strand:+ start:170 stop:646 length:477 start_codon:yes stop_codon:yes gene_type:complete
MSEKTTKQLITEEVQKLIEETKKSASEVKKIAIGEAWKVLQLLTAVVIQIIENIGKDLSSPEKKQLALELISKFYDEVFNVVLLPWIPVFVQSWLKGYIKQLLMLFVSSAIDALVTTFRNVGVFKPKVAVAADLSVEEKTLAVNDFINNFNVIIRNAV